MKKIFVIAGLLVCSTAFAATGAGAAAFIKFDGVKGEAKGEKGAEHGHARVRGGLNPANNVQAPTHTRGPNVAVGDVNGDGKDAREHGHPHVRGGLNPAGTVQGPQGESVGLLVPAVQKAHGQ